MSFVLDSVGVLVFLSYLCVTVSTY